MNFYLINIISSGIGFLDYIILKTIYILYRSKCILYDSLINLNILNYCNNYSLKILIGKRFNQYSLFKKSIYNLIFIIYKKYKLISKLKSGDINFFSRINNEINYYKINKINYNLIPGITTFVSSFSNLKWFISIRLNISTILFITYFNSNNLFKINKFFINKTIIYYMVNNNFDYILNYFIKIYINNFFICFIESCNFLSQHIYIFNIYDYIFFVNKNFLIFNLPKILIISNLFNYIYFNFLYINLLNCC